MVKTHLFWRLASALVLLAMLISPLGSSAAAPVPDARQSGMRVVDPSFVGVSQPLRSLAPIQVDANTPSVLRQLQDRLALPKTQDGLAAAGRDTSIVQDRQIGPLMPAPQANFEGVSNVSGVLPPDTQGDVGFDPATGKKTYVQWVNLAFEIWDVTIPTAPVSLYGPAAGNTLWAGTGTLCASYNDGDPITLYDHLSNRWLMSQFALSFPDDFHQCIAVSATPDPTGAWYLYDYPISTVVFNDYPHFGVWSDGYYMSINQFDGVTFDWAGAGAAVFERESMLAGQPARMIFFDVGATTLDFGGMLPSDLDGPAPVAGTPNYFVEWDDSTWLGDPADTLRVWEFHTDWSNPANSTFGANASFAPNRFITTANVDPNMCGTNRSCIPQPGTTQGLDAIADRLMHRLQYRNFGSYQTLVSNHTVDINGSDHAGIHWFELRDTGSGFALQQQGSYAPDSDHRWMGSAAMDASGDIALGYSVSSSTTYPSIRYAGRLATDTPGLLPQAETSLIAGSGSQTHSAARWGDYSMLGVDPSDDCTFWYTQEYVAVTGSASWQTRVGSFKFPSCTAEPTGVLSGTVTDASLVPLAGAKVEVSGGYTTWTDAAGHYAFNLVAGTYDVTASKYGYAPSTATGVVVAPPATTTQDFHLTSLATYHLSGVVTDATTGWPLYAAINVTGYPAGTVFSDPVTGAYSVDLAAGTYDFTASAMSGGYLPGFITMAVSTNATLDIALTVDPLACNAPGYQVISGTTLSGDGFDTSTAPAFSANWAVVDVSGTTGDWVTRTSSLHPSGVSPVSAPNMAVFNSWTTTSGQTRLYQLSGTDLSGQASAEVSLWMYHDTIYSNADVVQVQVSTDSGVTWNNAGSPIPRYTGSTGWAHHSVNIDAYTGPGMTDVRLGFLGISQFGNDIHIDDLVVATPSTCEPIPTAGLVIGAVLDANTGLTAPIASLVDAVLQPATWIDASADPATPDRMYVIGQPAGVRDLTASAPLYTAATESPLVLAGNTVGQDFHLAAGRLAASPSSLDFEVSAASPAHSQPLALDNTGTAAAAFEVFAIPGVFGGYAPSGPFADHTRHVGPKNLNDLDASKLRVELFPEDVPLINGGEVTASWPTGLAYAWGIGFNTDANDLWLGNIAAGGGDDLDYRFTTTGVNTGDTIDTLPWVSVFPADMTYNPFSKKLWQVNVGGDNCIYELDPASKVSTGNRICPAFGTSERGLAFDPLTNTYFAGSWNDGIINRFAPDGTLLASVNVGLAVAGLAYNPSTGHLFVMISGVGQPDVYVLDTHTPAYDIIGAFYLTDGLDLVVNGSQAGLEIDCAGNLWAVNQTTQMVYVADSGETGVCDWQAPWLSASPVSGSLAISGSTQITTSVDATGMAAGVYPAYLRVVGDTPYGDTIVQVTMNVTDSAPTITSDGGGATSSRSVAENTTDVTTVTATDLDGDPLTYSISGGSEAAFFSLTGAPGVLAFKTAPDYEMPLDAGANNTYVVTVQVSDGTLATAQTITVTVLDVVESYSLFLPLVQH